VQIAKRSAQRSRRGRVALGLRCSAPRGVRCTGRVALIVGRRALGGRKIVLQGNKRWRTVRVGLNAKGRAQLARAGRLRVSARTTSTVRVGRTNLQRRTITLAR
jgi:hypothetical protein